MKKMNVLITGATSGIGKAVAHKCAELGYNLILTGRRKNRLSELKDELQRANKIEVEILNFDVRNEKEVEISIKSLQAKSIDVLINNAGLALDASPINENKIEDWETMIDTNIKGLLYVSNQIISRMIEKQSGHIVNIGSIAGKEVYPNGGVYCATKHAVDALTKSMRIDLLKHGIKVTQIAPGMVETEFSIVRFGGDKQKADKVYEGLTPLFAEDIAEAVIFAITRPKHVNINDMLIMPTAQASATNVIRK